MEKTEIHDQISAFISQDTMMNIQELKAFHNKLEKMNARAILDDRVDKVIQDVEFFVRSAIFIRDIGRGDNWKLQLQAALGVIDSSVKHTNQSYL